MRYEVVDLSPWKFTCGMIHNVSGSLTVLCIEEEPWTSVSEGITEKEWWTQEHSFGKIIKYIRNNKQKYVHFTFTVSPTEIINIKKLR